MLSDKTPEELQLQKRLVENLRRECSPYRDQPEKSPEICESLWLELGGDIGHALGGTSLGRFLEKARPLLQKEFRRLHRDESSRKTLEAWLAAPSESDEAARLMREFFLPGQGYSLDEMSQRIEDLRKKRVVSLESLNEHPLENPAEEIIFTSNFLMTLPSGREQWESLEGAAEWKEQIARIMEEPQKHWYDHPVPLGTPLEANELVYGLRGLNRTAAFEKERGTMAPQARFTVILSLSVTHRGLAAVARQYVRQELQRAARQEPMDHLEVYVFTEEDCEKLIREMLIPASRSMEREEGDLINMVFGVDGEYGRHYSFLKAAPALYAMLLDKKKRATFKIDLDQVFPQESLVQETGQSALEHFRSPLWGARGRDSQGNPVYLGMIAGGLVNEKDIDRGLYTPDVPLPEEEPRGEERFFFKRLPMAVSTQAEIGTLYGEESGIDGRERGLHRIHVTGGTNGILLSALEHYRPFTPTFIGRAEDQSYLLSVLWQKKDGAYLRYAHQPGLRMRHDKEAFASEAIQAAKKDTFIGDLIRTLHFSHMTTVLPGGQKKIFQEVAPFTGAYIHPHPHIHILIRLLLKGESIAREEGEEAARDFLNRGAERLQLILSNFTVFGIAEQLEMERKAWDLFYDILAEGRRTPSAPWVERGRDLMRNCRI